MSMSGFADEFNDPEHYIKDITFRIWEERGVGLIRDWYAPDGPVRTPHGVTRTAEQVVAATLETMHEFPDRQLLAEDIIIGEKPEGFYSSHRVRSTATHCGDGSFGASTGQAVTTVTIADCLCRDNQVVDEWLVRDQASLALQLGLEPKALAAQKAKANSKAYTAGIDAMLERWADPNGTTVEGDSAIAAGFVGLFDTIWNGKNLSAMEKGYDRALRFEGPSGVLAYGRERAGNVLHGIMAALPDGRFEAHHVVVRQDPAKPVRVALRWSYCGLHTGVGRYGAPSGAPLALLGISHFELRDGAIVNEWMLVDDVAVFAQISAFSA